ncbi:MAG: ParB/RepB/Spo0J family partition protein [Candidatus Azambacteria bacterium]|nr:ParB/RepB/Spo0J family partition protein [Candidatus Azambacteria bacterium]
MTEKLEDISIDLIDDPSVPMRSQMDEEKLDELTRSIKTRGLIQPITLRKVGARYEVVAGHRRLKATKRAGLPFIKSIVRELSDKSTDEMRVHENLFREDVNPADEARSYKVMIDKYEYGPAELAEMVGKSEAYVRARYDLLSFPDYLFLAVENEHISLSAAQWLEKIEDDRVRKEYTKFGIIGGITAKRAEAWYRSWKLGSLPREAHMYEAPLEDPNAEPKKLMMPCVLCRYDDDIENMGMHYAHRDCAQAVAKIQSN